ncbi:hypothetical protein GUJ93_ZPchr0001g30781 [Zizania palustris]|uniref:Uncharacterized protein n=1 Tax=Zizania palustris TaxID=103762 RepID=A0A8J5UZT8_ZIZPA|nr:hypothetical protein GUJ93_ZPchr0001g30781 [Zizania palustris]
MRKQLVNVGLRDGDIVYVGNHGTKLSGQGFKCEVRACNSVPSNVQRAMRGARQLARKRKRETEQHKLSLERELMQGMKGRDEVIDLPSDEEGQIQMAIRNSLRDKNLSRVIERRHESGSGVRVSLGTDPTDMAIIYFMVYCNAHMFFHKSIDASSHRQSAVSVLDPDTYYKFNFSKKLEYALALSDAIEKMAETPDDVVEAIKEIVAFREYHGRFNRPVARAGASSMSPSKP